MARPEQERMHAHATVQPYTCHHTLHVPNEHTDRTWIMYVDHAKCDTYCRHARHVTMRMPKKWTSMRDAYCKMGTLAP